VGEENVPHADVAAFPCRPVEQRARVPGPAPVRHRFGVPSASWSGAWGRPAPAARRCAAGWRSALPAVLLEHRRSRPKSRGQREQHARRDTGRREEAVPAASPPMRGSAGGSAPQSVPGRGRCELGGDDRRFDIRRLWVVGGSRRWRPRQAAGLLPTIMLADKQTPLVPLWIRTQPEPYSEPVERVLPPRNRLPVIFPLLVLPLQIQWTASASSYCGQSRLALLTRSVRAQQHPPLAGVRV